MYRQTSEGWRRACIDQGSGYYHLSQLRVVLIYPLLLAFARGVCFLCRCLRMTWINLWYGGMVETLVTTTSKLPDHEFQQPDNGRSLLLWSEFRRWMINAWMWAWTIKHVAQKVVRSQICWWRKILKRRCRCQGHPIGHNDVWIQLAH